MEGEREVVLNEQLRFDLVLSANMFEGEFSKVSNTLFKRIQALSGLSVTMEYSQDIWKQEEKKIPFICTFTPPDLATPEQIQAFIIAVYQFAAELDPENFSLSMATPEDMLPIVTTDGIATPISFQPHTDNDIREDGKYRTITLASMTSRIGDAMPLVFKWHQECGMQIFDYKEKMPRSHQSYIADAALNKQSFYQMSDQACLQYLNPIFKPQLNRARNFIFGGLAGSLLGAAGIALAFLLLPPPLSFAAAGISAALLVAGLIVVGVNFWQSRNINLRIKASMAQIGGTAVSDESDSLDVSPDLAALGKGAQMEETGLGHSGPSPIRRPGLSSPNTEYDFMLVNLGGLLTMHRMNVHSGHSMDTVLLRTAFTRDAEALRNLLADTRDGLDEQKTRAKELIQGYKQYGIELPPEPGPAPK